MAEKSSELGYIEPADRGLATANFENDADMLEIGSDSKIYTDDETPSAEAEQIRGQIEATRSQMSETIDAIQDKLSIANITEQVKDQVSGQIASAVEGAKDAFLGSAADVVYTVGESFRQVGKSDLAKKAQENPWILSVAGMGIGVILFRVLFGGGGDSGGKKNKRAVPKRRKNRADSDDFDEIRYADKPFRDLAGVDFDESNDQTTLGKVSDAAGKTLAGVSSVADSTYKGVGSAANKTYESIGQASSFVYEKTGDLGEEMKKNYAHYIEENPLVVGAVAFAVGAAVGYAIPLTKTENDYMGEMRDNVLDKAQASAQEAIGTVKQVVGDAQQMIVDEVKSKTA